MICWYVELVQVVCCLYFKKFQSSPLLQKLRLPTSVNTGSDENKRRSATDGPSVQKIARSVSFSNKFHFQDKVWFTQTQTKTHHLFSGFAYLNYNKL